MVEEVERLLDEGIDSKVLKFYGLEYKFLTQYVLKEIEYNQMFSSLNTAIHQFAKRQETWWRKMEKNGTKIIWINGGISLEEKIGFIISKLR